MIPTVAAPLSCVIIDDNEINRLTLERAVQRHSQLTLAASLPDAVEALAYLHAGGQVDVLLLDIELPHLSGLELVRLLPEPKPTVVLVTTHTAFAVDAFELRVADYLVKPVNYARFCQAIARVLELRPAVPVPLALAPPTAAPGPLVPSDLSVAGTDLFIKTGNKLLRLNFEDVLFIEALSTYVVLVTDKQKHIVGGTLKRIAERLPFRHFVRVHRSYIVNLHRVTALEDNQLKLGQYEVPVSRPYHDELVQYLQAL